jgi:hypothetical protein
MTFVSPEAQIMEALLVHIGTLSWVKVVNWQKPLLSASDFRAHECPVVQLTTEGQAYTAERNDTIVRWRVFTEVIMCSEVTGTVDQLELLEKMHSLFQHIGSNFRLGGTIPGLIQILPIGSVSELHLVEPFYIGVLEWEISFRKWYTSPC